MSLKVSPYVDVPGPESRKRGCRDLFFLVLFGLCWGVLICVAVVALNVTAIENFQKGTDSNGKRCDGFVYFSDITTFNATKFCVSNCPNGSNLSYAERICNASFTVIEYPFAIANKSCVAIPYPTKPILGRCMPNGEGIRSMLPPSASDFVVKITQYFQIGIQQVLDFWPHLLCSLGVCICACFFWTICLRLLSGLIVWLSILGCHGVIAAIGYYTWIYYQKSPSDVILGVFICLCLVFLVVFLLSVSLRKQIKVAIQIMKESSKAIIAMPLIVFFPVYTFVHVCLNTVFSLILAYFVLNAPDQVSLESIKAPVTTNYFGYVAWYILFMYFWTIAFVYALNKITIAGAIASWYWSRDKNPKMPVLKSFYRAIRYNLGSLAFGSLLIAITRFLRAVLAYIQAKFKGGNKFSQFILSCLQCCLWCLEKFLKFLTSHAYIYMAIYGTSFCQSAKGAVELLVRNAFRLAAVNFVSFFIAFISKLVVSMGTALGLYFYVKEYVLCFLSWILCYIICTVFFDVFQMAADSIFLCVCEDSERNDGSLTKPYFMSKEMAQLCAVRK